jgi:hypothetical protein
MDNVARIWVETLQKFKPGGVAILRRKGVKWNFSKIKKF